MATDIDAYNRSFEEIVERFEEEADRKLRIIRQQCVQNFIERLHQREREWDQTFREFLNKSKEGDSGPTTSILTSEYKPPESIKPKPLEPEVIESKPPDQEPAQAALVSDSLPNIETSTLVPQPDAESPAQQSTIKPEDTHEEDFKNPLFSNFTSIREFVRIQELLEKTRSSVKEFTGGNEPTLKTYRNKLCQFIKQHVNSITTDTQHLDTKIKLFTRLLTGQHVTFQDEDLDVNRHPQAKLFSLDFAAQTFVVGGTKMPELAKSITSVITGIVENDLVIFRELIIGHLHERCPYLIPMYPKLEDFRDLGGDQGNLINYKIACGYCFDPKKQILESEEKYLARMRSMTLLYACLLAQNSVPQAWTWLTSFLSLKPQPVITATILQAFMQESSKKLSTVYGRQYKKLLNFIKDDYIRLIDEVMLKTTDKQSYVKLKNLLSDDKNLIAGPSISSIFGAIRY